MVVALAACGDDSDDATETVTVTQGADEGAGQDSGSGSQAETSPTEGGDSTGDSGNATGGDGSVQGGSVNSLVFEGTDIATQFSDVQCRADDGNDPDDAGEFEIDLRGENRGDQVEIDLNTDGDAIVEGLSVELEGKEWDSNDRQERDATVEVDGDTYRVSGEVEVDDDHPDAGEVAELEVEVSCAA